MNKIKSFTNWSLVFLCTTVLWLVFEQSKKMLTGDGTQAVSWPILGAMCIMVYYERKIRFLMKGSVPNGAV
jgi:hypothetical protein